MSEVVSRQRRWQVKQQAAGRCWICGKKRHLWACYCDLCQERQNAMKRAQRARAGGKRNDRTKGAAMIVVERPVRKIGGTT